MDSFGTCFFMTPKCQAFTQPPSYLLPFCSR
nr:MAG TPA: hypothetical protein [Crassvirales sp.]